MLRKAAILSFDALLALSIAAIAFGSVVSFSSLGADNSKNAQLNTLAWDYLHEKYELNLPISASSFYTLTGHSVNETAPSRGPAGHAMIYRYNAICNCSTNCYLVNGTNASCMQSQDNNSNYKFDAWVTP